MRAVLDFPALRRRTANNSQTSQLDFYAAINERRIGAELGQIVRNELKTIPLKFDASTKKGRSWREENISGDRVAGAGGGPVRSDRDIRSRMAERGDAAPVPWSFEGSVGARYWYGWGKTGKDLYGVSGTSEVSRLSYREIESHAFELFGRLDTSHGWFRQRATPGEGRSAAAGSTTRTSTRRRRRSRSRIRAPTAI